MNSLPKRIMEYAKNTPEATPICPGALLHLGKRPAIDQALSRLARSGHLIRVFHGLYMRPIETRFGVRAPSVAKAIDAVANLWGETIVPCGGSAANRLGLSTQNPIRMVYLTSGPSRMIHLGGQPIELRHAPRWQLVSPNRKSGDVVRALAWIGPEDVDDGLKLVAGSLSDDEIDELGAARAVMPNWMAESVSAWCANG